MEPFGLLRTSLGRIYDPPDGPLWPNKALSGLHMALVGPIWPLMDHYGPYGPIMATYGNLLTLLGTLLCPSET